MTVDLSLEEVETLLESLRFSRERVENAPGTPYSVRQQNLGRIDAAAKKLRQARSSHDG